MTHIVHPYSHRIGTLRDWRNRWFTPSGKQYREFLRTDIATREFLEKRLRGMYIASLEIERQGNRMRIIIKTSRPGMIIGRSGEGVTNLRADIQKLIRKLNLTELPELKIDVEEVRSPESNAHVVGEMIVEGLEKRMPFRRVMKQTIEKVMANRDVEGVRVVLGGRLGGADMGRHEELKKGRIPLQTIRADIEFARKRAEMSYGTIGVKVWIYKGNVFGAKQNEGARPAEHAQNERSPRGNREHRGR